MTARFLWMGGLLSSAQAEEGEDGEHDHDEADDINDVVHEKPPD
ncbi:hypothetical protein [Bosea sp. (in: a-proteobacteria)]|nr:hypothetical protein [Bosea sp. (in: a-proteobacteria)]